MDYFKSISCFLEDITGMTTLSTNTLNTSKAKMFYVGFWVVIYSYELVKRIMNITNGLKNISTFIALTIVNNLWVFTMFYRSLVRCRSIRSARLTLQSAQSQLVQGGIEIVPSQLLDLVIMAVVMITYGLTLLAAFLYSLFVDHTADIISRLLTTLHYNAILIAVSLGYLQLKFSLKIIYRSINKVLEDLRVPEDFLGEVRRPKRNRGTTAVVDSHHIELMVLAKKIGMEVMDAENKVNSYFSITIPWKLAKAALLCPYAFCLIIDNSIIHVINSGCFLLACSAFLLSFVYASVNGASSKKLPGLALKRFHTSRSEDHRTFLRRHVLSTIHCGDVQSCVFFDLEFSLILDMVDYGILMLTAICLK